MSKTTGDAVLNLCPDVMERALDLVRQDKVLGAETSSWSEVCPDDWSARERIYMLIEEGIAPVVGPVTPRSVFTALRLHEAAFWMTPEE